MDQKNNIKKKIDEFNTFINALAGYSVDHYIMILAEASKWRIYTQKKYVKIYHKYIKIEKKNYL